MATGLITNRIINWSLAVIITIFAIQVAGYFLARSFYDALAAKIDCANEARDDRKNSCYGKYFASIAYHQGQEYSFRVLERLQQQDPFARSCHLIAHGIGIGAYTRNPDQWQSTLQTINSACSNGAFHGIIWKAYPTETGEWLNPESLSTICGAHPRGSCNHALGHMILVETQGNVEEAITACGAFEGWQYEMCTSGVFMEQVLAFALVEHGLAPQSWLFGSSRLPEFTNLCRSYKDPLAARCFRESIHLAIRNSRDPHYLFRYCDSGSTSEGIRSCKRYAILLLVSINNHNLNPPSNEFCEISQENDPTFRRDCYLVFAVSTLFALPQATIEVSNYCLSLTEDIRHPCFFSMGRSFEEFNSSRKELETICGSVPNEFKNDCLGDGEHLGAEGLRKILGNNQAYEKGDKN